MKHLVRLCWALTLVFIGPSICKAVPILVLSDSNSLIRIETTKPQFVQSRTRVTGLQPGEKLLAIDFRPANGQLYGVTNGNRLYVINPTTGAATQVGTGTFSPALDFVLDIALDFNPVSDQLRVVTDNGQNLRINPTTAGVTVDSAIAFAAGDPNSGRRPIVSAAAYSPGSTSTTLYTVVVGQAQNPNVPTILATQGSVGSGISPNSGQLFSVGPMGFLFIEPTGLDIGQNGIAYALMNGTDTLNDLYTVDLGTGALTRIAIIGGSGDNLRDLAVIPDNSVQPAGTFQFELANYRVPENAGSVTLTVIRTGDTSIAASVDFASVDDTAQQLSDYIIAAGRLQFGPGEATKTFPILIIDDVYEELEESFNVYLLNATVGFVPGTPNPAVVTIPDNDRLPISTNPIDGPQFFVRQHYLDFLNRESDPGGQAYWTAQIANCGTDVACANRRRTGVSAAFYFSPEFQDTGYFVFRVYLVGLLRQPSYAEFTKDRNRLIVGSNLDANRNAFVDEFVRSPEFTVRHPDADPPEKYVDDLNVGSGSSLTPAERDALVAGLRNGTETRATVLRKIVDHALVKQRFFNRAFVLMQYFGYLRRNPDVGGFAFWLDILDRTGNFSSMVCAFITSPEYQQRFSTVQNHSNRDCGP